MANKRPAVDPAIHETAGRCARRCVGIIASLLRPEEMGEAVREFQAAIQEELAIPPSERKASNGR